MIRALMVDVDGVIVRHPGGRRWDHDLETDLGISRQTLQQAFFAPHWDDVVLGRADLNERLAVALADVAPHLSAATLTSYWFEKDACLDHGLLNALAGVRDDGLALHLATVQEHRRADHLWTHLGLKNHFDAMHYAAEYGTRKPDAAFFNAVCARTGFKPEDLLLIDDSPRNIEAARDCGWAAALWDATRSLQDVLADEGLRT